MYAQFMNNVIHIHDSYLHRESIKQIKGRIWNSDKKVWMIPASNENLLTLTLLGCILDDDLMVRLNEHKSEETSFEKPLLHIPVKVTPYQHQIKAFNFVCRVFDLPGGESFGCCQG